MSGDSYFDPSYSGGQEPLSGETFFPLSNSNARNEMQLAFESHPSKYLRAAQNQTAILKSLSEYVSGIISDEDRSYKASVLSSNIKKSLIQIDQLPLQQGQYELCRNIADDLIDALDEISRSDGDFECNLAMRLCNLVMAAKSAFENCDSFEVREFAINGVDRRGNPLEFSIDTIFTLTHASGVVFDVDDCLILSEASQQIVWNRVFDGVIAEFGANGAAAYELKQVYDLAYKTSSWKNLMPNLGSILVKYNIFPNGVTYDKETGTFVRSELDAFFRERRIPQLIQCCEKGEIVFTPGAVDFLKALRERGIEIGIFTSSSKALSDSMLSTLLEAQGINYEELIPASHRVYGPSLSRQKPDPYGWYVASDNLGLLPRQVILFDDKMKILAHAAASTPNFGATIGIYHRNELTPLWRQSTITRSFDNGGDGEIFFNHQTIFGFVKDFECFRVK